MKTDNRPRKLLGRPTLRARILGALRLGCFTSRQLALLLAQDQRNIAHDMVRLWKAGKIQVQGFHKVAKVWELV